MCINTITCLCAFMNYAMVRNSSFLPLQSYEKNASISWLSPISTEQFSVEGASLDIFFFWGSIYEALLPVLNCQNTHTCVCSDMYKKLKGLECRQADGQTNIKYIHEGKTWKELHTFIPFPPCCFQNSWRWPLSVTATVICGHYGLPHLVGASVLFTFATQ